MKSETVNTSIEVFFHIRGGGGAGGGGREEIAVEKQWKIDENEGMVRTTRDEFSRE